MFKDRRAGSSSGREGSRRELGQWRLLCSYSLDEPSRPLDHIARRSFRTTQRSLVQVGSPYLCCRPEARNIRVGYPNRGLAAKWGGGHKLYRLDKQAAMLQKAESRGASRVETGRGRRVGHDCCRYTQPLFLVTENSRRAHRQQTRGSVGVPCSNATSPRRTSVVPGHLDLLMSVGSAAHRNAPTRSFEPFGTVARVENALKADTSQRPR